MYLFIRIIAGVFLATTSYSVLFAQDASQIIPLQSTQSGINMNPGAFVRIDPVMEQEYTDTGTSQDLELITGQKIELIYPLQDPIFTRTGKVLLPTISSFQSVNEGVGLCSLLARNNLEMMLRNLGGGPHRIYQGDAIELILNGLKSQTLTVFTERDALIQKLEERKKMFVETVFDFYRYAKAEVPLVNGEPERTPAYFEQGHRAVIFLGYDEQWYILDTIQGAKIKEPQLLSEYLGSESGEDKQWLLRMPGYTGVDLVSDDQFVSIFPFLSPELQLWWNGKREFVTYDDTVVYSMDGMTVVFNGRVQV